VVSFGCEGGFDGFHSLVCERRLAVRNPIRILQHQWPCSASNPRKRPCKATVSISPPLSHSQIAHRQTANPMNSATLTTSSKLSSSAAPDEVHSSGHNLIQMTGRPRMRRRRQCGTCERVHKVRTLVRHRTKQDDILRSNLRVGRR
jgi:hypothetical protein